METKDNEHDEHIDLCRQLRKQGFRPSAHINIQNLIDDLGDKFGVLERFHGGGFGAYIPNDCGVNGIGETPLIALMKLWLIVQDME